MKKLKKIAKTGTVFAILFSSKEAIKAQGGNSENNFKGLLENRFDSLEKWSVHFQFTDIWSGHPAFNAKYSGNNSLQNISESAMSVTSTLFLGRKLWKGASVFVNPEIAGGSGLSYAAYYNLVQLL